MLNLTPEMITKVSTVINGQRAEDLARLHNLICPKYGIDSADIFHEFFSNVLHESGCFMIVSESLNYSVESLLSMFSRQRISVDEASRFGRKKGQTANEPAIGNAIYGGEWGKRNLGNEKPFDGYLFRGAGPMQITGRANFTAFTKFYNDLTGTIYTLDEMSKLLRTNIEVGIHSACWVFAIAKKLNNLAADDKINWIVKKINGGYNGLPERMKYYERCKQFIV